MSSSQKKADAPPDVQALEVEATPEAANRLSELARITNGAVAKAARTALFRLKSRGIIPSQVTGTIAGPTGEKASTIEAYICNVDGSSNQIVMFLVHGDGITTDRLISLIVSPTYGVREMIVTKEKLSHLKTVVEQFGSREGTLVVPVGTQEAMSITLFARSNTISTGGILPVGLHDALTSLGIEAPIPDRPLIFGILDSAGIVDDLTVPRDPVNLLSKKGMTTWWIPFDVVNEWEEKYFDRVQSPLAPDENARMAMGEPIIDEATNAVCLPAFLSRIKRDLEEQAWVFQVAGEPESAKMAFYHSVMIDPSKPGVESRFAREMVKRSIMVCMALKAEAEFPDASEQPEPPDVAAPQIAR